MHRRPLWHIWHVSDAPTGPAVAVGYRLAAPGPSGAAPGPLEAPNGAYLAPVRSHLHAERKCRPRGGLAAAAAVAERASCAPRTPPTLLATARAAPAAAATAWRPLRRLRAARRPPQPASSARIGGAAVALRPAPTRQTGRDESWATRARGPGSAAAASAASGRATAAHEASRTHMQRFLHAPLTSRNRPRRAPKRSSVAPMAAAMTPGMRAVRVTPPMGAATRVEVPVGAE